MNNSRQAPSKKSNITGIRTSGRRDPLRIAVIVKDLRFPFDEGAKKTSFSLISSFIKKGVKVTIFTRHRNPLLENAFSLPGNKFLFGYSFTRNLREQAPDFILNIPTSSGTVGAFIRAAMIKTQAPGIPLALLNLQYRELPEYSRYFNLHRHADIVFTQSQASADVFRSYGCKTILLSGGVDHTIFQSVSRQEKRLPRLKCGFQDADRIVLHIGHCNRDRNVITLAQLAKSRFKAIMVASTSTAIDRDLLAELRQAGVTIINDFLENIQHYYQMADCYLFPVLRATSAIDAPLSVLEAMACNLPIVTTKFGTLPSMFQSGNGFYYGDTEEEIVFLVKQTLEKQNCKTFEKVSLYS